MKNNPEKKTFFSDLLFGIVFLIAVNLIVWLAWFIISLLGAAVINELLGRADAAGKQMITDIQNVICTLLYAVVFVTVNKRNAAGSAHTDEGVGADLVQLLHGNGSGGAADAGGAHGHLFAQQRAGVDGIFPILGNKYRIVKMGGDGLAAPRITGQQAIAAYIALCAADMKLFFHFLHSGFLL